MNWPTVEYEVDVEKQMGWSDSSNMPLAVSLVCGVCGIIEVPSLIWLAASGSVGSQMAVNAFELLPLPALGLVVAATLPAQMGDGAKKVRHIALLLNLVGTLLLPLMVHVLNLAG